MRYDLNSARKLAIRVCVASGASKAVALSLAEATIAAKCSGRSSVGFAHLPDYMEGFLDGRIASTEEPMGDQIERLSSKGIHIPGGSFVKEEIDLPSSLVATLEKYY
ncbi:hypothetical protein [Paenibacillus agri]|uniref:Uncharacterized protein n=1 Tax=Paenibacillus agri TaxID=2744309 RepID=A0A850EXZ0_9BACL|nr:hypothetical protein [Paenibacillus agri]NUU64454.1 hypothetical protein [Paenibacillus agri]